MSEHNYRHMIATPLVLTIVSLLFFIIAATADSIWRLLLALIVILAFPGTLATVFFLSALNERVVVKDESIEYSDLLGRKHVLQKPVEFGARFSLLYKQNVFVVKSFDYTFSFSRYISNYEDLRRELENFTAKQ